MDKRCVDMSTEIISHSVFRNRYAGRETSQSCRYGRNTAAQRE